MIQSHYFVERMVLERPQELLRVAREMSAARAARESRAALRAAREAASARRYHPLAHLLADGLAEVGRALVSLGRRLEAVRERREQTLVSPLAGSCVVCGESGSSFPRAR